PKIECVPSHDILRFRIVDGVVRHVEGERIGVPLRERQTNTRRPAEPLRHLVSLLCSDRRRPCGAHGEQTHSVRHLVHAFSPVRCWPAFPRQTNCPSFNSPCPRFSSSPSIDTRRCTPAGRAIAYSDRSSRL